MTITDEPTKRGMVVLRDLSQHQLISTWEWCTQRWGLSFSSRNPAGYWTFTQSSDNCLLITLPSQEMTVELELIEPWNT